MTEVTETLSKLGPDADVERVPQRAQQVVYGGVVDAEVRLKDRRVCQGSSLPAR